jgi:protein-L-isoaspartate(D-aspartate) O-methyltransferase
MDTDFAARQMVRQQIRAWDVSDSEVLRVFASVPRQQFVPAQYRDLAFSDSELPLAHGQRMMTPTIEGRVLQSLSLTDHDRVLEIGTGSAFLTACLSQLAASVCSIDIFDGFVSAAREKLSNEGLSNVELACMDATVSLPDGEFDAIVVTGSLPALDDRYVAKLRPGGRLFVVVGSGPVQEARIIVRHSDTSSQSTSLFETCLMPLINSIGPARFSF